MMAERYQAGSSPIHTCDARVKVIVAVLLIVGIVLTPSGAFPAYPLLWALIGSLATVANMSVWRLARFGGIALPFSLAAATLLFTIPGQPILSLAGLSITDAGLTRFVDIVIKSWLAVQVALLLSITTQFTDLLWALSNLRVPHTLIAIVGFMYRYLFTLGEEAERMLRARAARSGSVEGYQSGGGMLWRARITGGMVGSLLLRSYERSERVYAAMLARGFDGQIKMKTAPPLSRNDIGLGALPVLVVLAIQLAAYQLWSG